MNPICSCSTSEVNYSHSIALLVRWSGECLCNLKLAPNVLGPMFEYIDLKLIAQKLP